MEGDGKDDTSTLSAQSEIIAVTVSRLALKLRARANDMKLMYNGVSFYDGVTFSNIWL